MAMSPVPAAAPAAAAVPAAATAVAGGGPEVAAVLPALLAGGLAALLAGGLPAALLVRLAVGPLDRLLRRRHPLRNWLGEEVTVAGGVAVAAGSLAGLALLLFLAGPGFPADGGTGGAGDGGRLPLARVGSAADGAEAGRRLLAAAAIAFLGGLWDDLAGGTGPRGLRGHLRALLKGRPGTGTVKGAALLGAGVAVALPQMMAGQWLQAAVTVSLVGLAGNLANCLDVRPGRAVKGFLAAGLGLLAAAGAGPLTAAGADPASAAGSDPAPAAGADPVPAAGADPAPAAGAQPVSAAATARLLNPVFLLLPFLGAAAAHLPLDLARRTMLGDAGANLLGVAAGAVLAETLTGPARAVVLLLLLGLQALAELVSLSDLIERSRWLRWLDLLGRQPPLAPPATGKEEAEPRDRLTGAANGEAEPRERPTGPLVPFSSQGERRIMGPASGPPGQAGGGAGAGPRG